MRKMEFKSILNYLGGASFILWIIKSTVDFINQRNILTQQNKFSKEIERIKTKQESLIFISNKQYEKEFEIYLELFELLAYLDRNIEEIYGLLRYLEQNKDFKDQQIVSKQFNKVMDDTHKSIEKMRNMQMRYSPFILVSIKNATLKITGCVESARKEITDAIIKNNNSLEEFDFLENEMKLLKSLELLRSQHELMSKEVREYLNKLKVKDMNW